MKLSIVIVNYNVCFFLEQCLQSVFKATAHLPAEVFVVDNASVDGSVEMVREKFPEVQLIANTQNVGFSKANNQAIRISKGEYVLLLNPDTIVEEATFQKTVSFMDENPQTGGLGVRMIDGKGRFLPESKRGLPTPWVSLYKMVGLGKLFPKSKRFGQYHLSFLPENEIHEIDILSGAFMLMRKSVLDEVGLLDETFFMYGEDIDLSYRIQLGGYQNVYFPETTIIHYKGESTKKGSINYVLVFYKAMEIFAQKHFAGQYSKILLGIIHFAIYLRMATAILSRIYRFIALPVLDLVFFSAFAFVFLKFYLEANHNGSGEWWFQWIPFIYGSFCASALLLLGNNKNPLKIRKPLKDGLLLSIGFLLVYNFLPESLRFSRLGSMVLALSIPFLAVTLRWIYSKLLPWFELHSQSQKNVLLVADEQEQKRIEDVFSTTTIRYQLFKRIDPSDIDNTPFGELVTIGKINEIVFSGKNISSKRIMDIMSMPGLSQVDFKIAPTDSIYIIGSNSVNENGELYSMNMNALGEPHNVRKKRFFDFAFSLMVLSTFPFWIWSSKTRQLLAATIPVLLGRKTWIGFVPEDPKIGELPQIKPGILHPGNWKKGIPTKGLTKINRLYARDYSILQDVEIVLQNVLR